MSGIPQYIVLFRQKLWQSLNYIFPPFFSVILLSYDHSAKVPELTKVLGFILAAILVAAFAYFLNDLTDIKIDAAAKKPNIAAKMPNLMKGLIVLVLPISGILVFYLMVNKSLAIVLLLLEVLCLIIYSVKPLRGKRSPIWGPMLDSHYGHVLPIFITFLAFFDLQNIDNSIILSLVLLYFLLLFKGSRNILLHQIQDRKMDKKSGLLTFPNKFGPVNTIKIINYVLIPLEISLIVLLSIKHFNYQPIFAYCFGAFLIFYFFNFSAWEFPRLNRKELFLKFWYFLNDYYEFWIPFICIWAINISIWHKIGFTVICIFLLWKPFKKFIKEIRVSILNVFPPY